MKRLILLLTACSAGACFAVDIGKGWTSSFSKGDGQSENVLPLTQIPDLPKPIAKPGGCKFSFPQHGHANYLTRRGQGGAKKFVEVKMKIAGSAKFIPLDGGAPATAHVYIEEGVLFNNWWARGTTWTPNKDYFDLQKMIGKGVVTIRMPLSPESWQNVVGQPADLNADTLKSFRRAVSNMGHAGVTFGGWSQWGHGVKIQDGGRADCTLVSLTFVD